MDLQENEGGEREMNLFQMSDAQLDSMVERHYDKLFRDAYERPEPHCKDCIHYVASCGQCERMDEDFTEIDPDEDVCDFFDANEYQPPTEY